MKPPPTIERVWLGYLAAVTVVAATAPELEARARLSHLVVHGAVLAAVLRVRWIAVHRSPDAARFWRAALAIVGLPVVFSAMAWLLPGVHPEPYEYLWLAVDRAWFGEDFARLADRWLAPWSVELLQVVYACFYGIPILAALGALRRSGSAAFDRAMLLLVGGFLASYLGYLLVPTLGPKVVLAHAADVQGLWVTGPLRRSIDGAEANPWDCFPSGHTMLTVASLIIAWRWHRVLFWCLLVPASLLIASTMLLRYHWAIDVAVGALVAWPWARLCDHLADRDGWPPAPAAGRAAGVTPA